MISRRLLRIKVLQALYAYYKKEKDSLALSEKELFHSIDKTFELYHCLFRLVLDLVRLARKKIDISLNKKIPSWQDLNPNTKFVDNRVIAQLGENRLLNDYFTKNGVSWDRYPELVRRIYRDMTASDYFKEYMQSAGSSYDEDKTLIVKLLSHTFLESEDLSQNLEEQSIYWNDELDFVVGMMIRTLRKFRETDKEEACLLRKFKNDDDIEYTRQLFRKTITGYTDSVGLIEKFSENWDIERIAFMDILIMSMAICELREFADIPVKVTINEYIEIAKFYSTEKSGTFVNGILDKTVQYLRDQNLIRKHGRGLVGEI